MKKKGVEKGGSETPLFNAKEVAIPSKKKSPSKDAVWESFPQPPLPLWVVR